MKRAPKIALAVLGLFLLLGAIVLLLKEPRNDRDWLWDLSRDTTAAYEEDGTVVLTNVRDWTYAIGETVSEEWIPEVRVHPADVVRAWFVLEPFAEWEAMGHTYLTFELSDGSAYSFSVEARRESDEGYSAFLGLFRHYELSYTWGTERDFLARRLLYLEHPVRMYPLLIEQDAAKTLFLKLIEKTNEVAEHPRFYHTLTANCTNVLAELANESAPGSLPYDLSWNLPGFSDSYLMRMGLIPIEGTPEETKAAYDLTPYRADVAAIATLPPAEFRTRLRALPPFQNEARDDITP